MKTKRSLAVLAATAVITLATLACQLGTAAPLAAQPQADAPSANTQPAASVPSSAKARTWMANEVPGWSSESTLVVSPRDNSRRKRFFAVSTAASLSCPP